MPTELHEIEPWYGWLRLYSNEQDELSPFHGVEPNPFEFDRSVNRIPAHPLWDEIGSESLLVKILFADYETGYAIIELFGEWNDLFDNDYKLLAENCLTYLVDNGIKRFVLICENVFHVYLETDDYYEAMQEELDDGYICLLRTREHVREEMQQYQIAPFFFWSEELDSLPWRKLSPGQLFRLVDDRMRRLLA